MGTVYSSNRAPHTPSGRSISTNRIMINEQQQATTENENASSVSNNNAAAAAPIMERLVTRDLPYHQSSNCLRVRHQMMSSSSSRQRQRLSRRLNFFWYVEDWFHVLLRLRTTVSILLFVTIWTGFLAFFAWMYVVVDGEQPEVDCGLGEVPNTITFYTAFAFSLETTTTVGYGLPNGNGFFNNCPNLQVAIYFQMLFSMFFNAFLLSFLFARISRSERRATQVLFSSKAILNRTTLPNGIKRYMLSNRIYDADSMYPIVEAHVRFYAVKHRGMHAYTNRGVRYPMNMEPMRVSIPNDDLGAVLHASIPTRATHHIDYHSPLNPPSKRKLGPEDGRIGRETGFVVDSCGMDLRENDTYTGGQDGLRCMVCGETYGTVANLVQHIRYCQHMERHDGVPVEGSHQELDVDNLFFKGKNNYNNNSNNESSSSPMLEGKDDAGEGLDGNNDDVLPYDNDAATTSTTTKIDIDKPPPKWYDTYRNYLRESNVEIICIMEAIDPIMSGTFQAIQSYTLDDIVFDADFAPCVMADNDHNNPDGGEGRRKDTRWFSSLIFFGSSAVGRSVKIDLDSFHETVKFGEG